MNMNRIDFDFDNVGGISRMYAIDVRGVHALTPNVLTGRYRLSLHRDAAVIEIPVYAPDSTSFSERQQLDDAGDVFHVSISGFIPRQNGAGLVQALERGSWLVIHQDANGDILLSGSVDVPLVFTSDKSSGGDGGLNGNSFTFSAVEPAPSVLIDTRAFYL